MKEYNPNINKSKYLKCLEEVTDKDMLSLIVSHEKIYNRPIESLNDLESILKFMIQNINHFKRQQYCIIKLIEDLKTKGTDEGQLKIWKSLFIRIASYQAMYSQSVEILTECIDLHRYEPELLDDPIKKADLNKRYHSHIDDWIKFITKQFN